MLSARFSHDDAVVSCGMDCTVRLWDWHSTACVAVFAGHVDGVQHVQQRVHSHVWQHHHHHHCDTTASRRVGGGMDPALAHADWVNGCSETGALLPVSALHGHKEMVLSACFSHADGSVIFSAPGADNAVRALSADSEAARS